MDVEIAGLTTTVTRGARGAPAETVYERIKMMLKTHEATMPNPRYVEEVQVDGFITKWRYRTVQYMLSFNTVGLCDETLSLAINLFDRYLSRKSIQKSCIELTCVVCIMLASKLIENDANYFRVEDVVGAVKNVTEKDVCKQELDVIQALGWEINAVTSVGVMLHFEELTHGVLNSKAREKVTLYAHSFLDHAACNYEFLCFSPVVQSCSALLCAFHNANFDCIEWYERMLACGIDLVQYELREAVRACSLLLLDAFYKCYPQLESANVKHNIALTSDGMRWNEYMDHEATMVEEHAGDGSRMCISPTNLMGDLRRDDGSLGQVYGREGKAMPESEEGRSDSPMNVQDIANMEKKYKSAGAKPSGAPSANMCQGEDGKSRNLYSYAQEAKAIGKNVTVVLPTSSSNGATRWVVGGSLGNTVAFR